MFRAVEDGVAEKMKGEVNVPSIYKNNTRFTKDW
jgi:hypothetical protein